MDFNFNFYQKGADIKFGPFAGFFSHLEQLIMNELDTLKAQLATNTEAITNAVTSLDRAIGVIGGFKAQLEAAIEAAHAGDMAPLADMSASLALEDTKMNDESAKLNAAIDATAAVASTSASAATADSGNAAGSPTETGPAA